MKYVNKKTGTVYVTCVPSPHGFYYLVTTERTKQPYIVDAASVKAVK
jgi:hypothetical protein